MNDSEYKSLRENADHSASTDTEDELVGEIESELDYSVQHQSNLCKIALYSQLAYLVTGGMKAQVLSLVIDLACICLLLGAIAGNFFFSSKVHD